MLNSVAPAADVDRDSDVVSSFSFKHDGGPVSLPCISDLTKKVKFIYLIGITGLVWHV